MPDTPDTAPRVAAAGGPSSRARRAAIVWGLFAVALAAAPHVFPSDTARTLLSQMGTAMILALSFNLLLGQTGMLSFCHAAYAGFGAYAAVAALNAIGQGGWAWLPVTLIPLVGGLAGALAGVLLGYITTRRSGMAFAMITLGVAELVWMGAIMLPAWFGGERGITTDRMAGPVRWGISYGPQIQVYYLVAGWLFVSALAMYGLARTPLGFLARAVRDNAERVAFIGCDPAAVRYRMQIVAGFFAGIAGGLTAVNFEVVSAEHFSLARSGAVLLFTVLGGTAYFAGPMLGAIAGVLATMQLSAWTQAWQLYLGLLFLGVVMFAPGGLAGLCRAHWLALRQPAVRRLWPGYLAVVLSACVGALGLIALIEMGYRARLDDALGDGYTRWLMGWDWHDPRAWALASAYGVVGLAGLMLALPRFVRARRVAQWVAQRREAGVPLPWEKHEPR